ncbi:thioesterase domain-containing protein (plasmid) [Alkalihalophilus pseudofirmus]|uniref:thioesterase II family protein n=1 Tax=Alkalihalophilus pseudofirmus TaxID=79885 RepID=UPI00259B2512|nr:thioesterase domain-containing protein [Alkalihalophilus pseudofirmus]WEG19167.1 thioesterase domain-containing protein [Alkalihalophilus pseudofirmus]
MKLFCIPHAGASSISYNGWRNHLNSNINFIPLELPGHMTRSNEKFCRNMDEVIQDLKRTFEKEVSNNEDYSIFGHSLGSVILYYLYFDLIKSGFKPPKHLFFSSRWPPYHENKKANYDLNDLEECKSKFIKMGGFKEEIIKNKPLLDYYLDILVADYQIIQSTPLEEPRMINTDMSILWSNKEIEIDDSDIYKWKLSAGSSISFNKVNGTHFYPTELPEKTVNIINKTLIKYEMDSLN